MCSALKIPIEVSGRSGGHSWQQLLGALGGLQPGALSLQKRAGLGSNVLAAVRLPMGRMASCRWGREETHNIRLGQPGEPCVIR